MASIQPYPKGAPTRWRVMYRVDGRQCTDTFADEAAAVRHLRMVERLGGVAARELLHQREGVAADDPADIVTTTAWVRRHIDRLEGITDGTRLDYRRMVDLRLDGTPLGECPLDLVTREAVAAWVHDLPGASKTKRNYHALLSAALARAVDEDVLPKNPAHGVKIARTEAAPDMVLLTRGEFAILLAAIPAQYQPLVAFLAGTGLRFSEATALRVAQVDLDAPVPVVRVTRAWKRQGDGKRVEGPPKTRAGIRTVSLPPQTADAIRPLVEGRRSDSLVFTTPGGRAISHGTFYNRTWKATLDRLNDSGALTKRPRLHDLRHLQASLLVEAGVPLNIVQRRLGHEKITTTVDTYSHLLPDHLEVAARAIALGLAQAMPELEAD